MATLQKQSRARISSNASRRADVVARAQSSMKILPQLQGLGDAAGWLELGCTPLAAPAGRRAPGGAALSNLSQHYLCQQCQRVLVLWGYGKAAAAVRPFACPLHGFGASAQGCHSRQPPGNGALPSALARLPALHARHASQRQARLAGLTSAASSASMRSRLPSVQPMPAQASTLLVTSWDTRSRSSSARSGATRPAKDVRVCGRAGGRMRHKGGR